MSEADTRTANAGKDGQYQLLNKVTASLMTACAALCILLARGAAVHDIRVLKQVRKSRMLFVAPDQAGEFVLLD